MGQRVEEQIKSNRKVIMVFIQFDVTNLNWKMQIYLLGESDL